jgi:hypothetical protein
MVGKNFWEENGGKIRREMTSCTTEMYTVKGVFWWEATTCVQTNGKAVPL